MIALLLSSFPNFQSGDAESLLAAYEMAVSGCSDYDLAEAVKAFIQGRVPGHNMAFAPTAPQLASVCRRAMELRIDEVNRRRHAVLQIEARDEDCPRDAESRARVAAMVASALKNLSMNDQPRAKDNENRRAEMMKKHDERFMPTLQSNADAAEAGSGD